MGGAVFLRPDEKSLLRSVDVKDFSNIFDELFMTYSKRCPSAVESSTEPSVQDRALTRSLIDQSPNYGGRFRYYEALAEHWPKLLVSLRIICFDVWSETHASNVNRFPPFTMGQLRSRIGYERCCESLTSWAQNHGICDEWLLDGAVQTLNYLCTATGPDRWVYIAPELPLPMFELRLEAVWIPPQMSSEEFDKALHRQLTGCLAKYRSGVAGLWGDDRRSQLTHAIWTVWWQQELSSGQILLKSGKPRSVTSAAIHMAIRSFATSIGLTLRKGRFGPTRRQ